MILEPIRRLRMFSGPNGAGKTTIAYKLERDFSANGHFSLRPFLNADELLVILESGRAIDVGEIGFNTTQASLLESVRNSGRLLPEHPFFSDVTVHNSQITMPRRSCDAYVAAAIVDFLREQLLGIGASFSYETVMSHQSKVEFFARAARQGYRTYLYFVATESPTLNSQRVFVRAERGGHAVPAEKIVQRYERSLSLVGDVVSHAHRAFFFDNSGSEPVWIAQVSTTDGLELKVAEASLPAWFKTWVWPRIPA